MSGVPTLSDLSIHRVTRHADISQLSPLVGKVLVMTARCCSSVLLPKVKGTYLVSSALVSSMVGSLFLWASAMVLYDIAYNWIRATRARGYNCHPIDTKHYLWTKLSYPHDGQSGDHVAQRIDST